MCEKANPSGAKAQLPSCLLMYGLKPVPFQPHPLSRRDRLQDSRLDSTTTDKLG
jgi:hypothetical protein